MARRKLGLWLIGAKGGVATTVTVGLAALRRGLTGTTGLVSALPQFARLDFADWGDFTIGGHEIRETTLFAEAQQLVRGNHALDADLVGKLKSDLDKLDKNTRSGTLVNVGATIAGLAEPSLRKQQDTPRAAIERVQGDLTDFIRRNSLERLIVVNLASTEPAPDEELPAKWKDF